ncbi:MAG: AAA family ATPase [Paracoccaceae bacterium]
MKRVMIVGGPGSGKSTMAVALGQITGLPVFHMDHIHYRPGWVEREPGEKLRLAAEIHARDRWIFEGGLSKSYSERAVRADTVIWLDLPLRLRYGRIVKRRIEYNGRSRADLPDDCPERLDPAFLAFMFRTRNSARAAIAKALSEHPQVHHIRTAKGVDTFLDWCRLG